MVTDVLYLNIQSLHYSNCNLMKTKVLPWRNLMLVGASLLVGLPNTARAQDEPAISAGRSTSPGFDITITDGRFNRNGEMAEATLENVVDLLRARHPEANIIVAPEVPPISIENLKIRATDLQMELEAVQVASGGRFNVRGRGSKDNPLYVLEAAPGTSRERLQIEAYSLAGYFASLPKTDNHDENEALIDQKIEELDRMVHETVEIYRSIDDKMYGHSGSRKTGLNMRFHRGANLVILIGDPESVQIASKVITALPNAQRAGGSGDRHYELYPFGGGGEGGVYGMAPYGAVKNQFRKDPSELDADLMPPKADESPPR